MENDFFLSRVKLKPNRYLKMVLDHYVPANMVSTCFIGNLFDQSVSAKYARSRSILVNKTVSSTRHL